MSVFILAISALLNIIQVLIFVRIIVSWIRLPRDNPLMVILYQLTEPILAPIRNIIHKSAIGGNMMLDFSPIVAFLLIRVIQALILG